MKNMFLVNTNKADKICTGLQMLSIHSTFDIHVVHVTIQSTSLNQ